MAKTRTVEREFWDDRDLRDLDSDTRLLALAMITRLADDEGRFRADPSFLRKEVFFYQPKVTDARVIDMLVTLLKSWGNLVCYQEDGEAYVLLRKFQTKQGIRYVVQSKLPPPTSTNVISDFHKFREILGNFCSRDTRAPRLEVDVEVVPKPSVSNKKGARVPDPFPITPEMVFWAAEKVPGLDINAATEEFVDYWKGVTDRFGVKLDWPATWRNGMKLIHKKSQGQARASPTQRDVFVAPKWTEEEKARLGIK